MSEKAYNASEQFNRSWDEIPDEYVPPAPGVYLAKITEATKGATKRDGKPQVTLTVKLLHSLVTDEAVSGQSRFNRVMITQGEGAFRLKQLVKAADVSFPASPKPDDVEAFCEELLGRELYVMTRNESKDGRTYINVSRYLTEEQAREAASNFDAGAGDAE